MVSPDTILNFHKTPALSTTDTYDLNEASLLDDNGLRVKDYAPIQNITIVNTGTTLLLIKINQKGGYDAIPAGVIWKDTSLSARFIQITNTSGSASGEYYMKLDSQDTLLAVAKRILDSILRFKMWR